MVGPQRLLFHSVVLPSEGVNSGTRDAILVGPKPPVSKRSRLPCRCPALPCVPSQPARTRKSRSEPAADQFFNKFPRVRGSCFPP